eukprot:Clim_evm3s67 gene=Clim_evmTU3s67
MSFRMLDVVAPFVAAMPSVEKPLGRLAFNEKLVYTGVTLLIFLVMSQVPLYGYHVQGADPLFLLRVILASNRGTLMELGISPIVTSGLIMQLLAGAKLIEVNQQLPRDRELFEGAQKLFGMVMTVAQAVLYVAMGMYGPVDFFTGALIVAQLTIAGVVVMLLDELLQNGYGIGSGISLFIATNICENIMWQSLSPMTTTTGMGTEYEGAVVEFISSLVFKYENKASHILNAFWRTGAPNMMNLLATVVVFAVVTYFQGFRVDIPIQHKTGHQSVLPIKLFYTSNMPIILQSALTSQISILSNLLYSRFPDNLMVQLLGTWSGEGKSRPMPIGGLAYYISPPRGLVEMAAAPLHTAFYVVFMLSTCAMLSTVWIDFSGSSAYDLAKTLKAQQYTIKGYRPGKEREYLNRYIPVAAAFGGICIGALSIVADAFGAIGSGTGILLAVTITYQYFEAFMKEQAESMSNMKGMMANYMG